GFDFLLVSAPDGAPLAGVIRANGELVPVNTERTASAGKGLLQIDGRIFQTASVAIDQAAENLGALSVGNYFDFSDFTTPAVLMRNGRVLKSSVPGVTTAEIDRAMGACGAESECDIRLREVNYISLPLHDAAPGGAYVLRSIQNVDAAVAPVLVVLRSVFLTASIIAVLVALLCSVASARTIVRPIGAMIAHLRHTERTGELPEFSGRISGVREICDLTRSFNRAAVSIRDARHGLQTAYLEFVESLANALDARDPYTAGHSFRVSRLSSSTARALGLSHEEVERVRVGALLHDIGKIGIDDRILQKPAPLAVEEMNIVKSHPGIGRRILEGVHGFAAFLGAVEFHHENWNGTGYPLGQFGEQTPIDARIIHVADSYDAMTSDRPYRRGMTHERAVAILSAHAGTQFDPRIVEVFVALTSGEAAATEPCAEFASVGVL
ncbi:MAG: HD domain-containing protein, partial [Acidobacteriota bacterium]|nr:HD domain-containing protein [Acidobacteriota bacterium]